MKKVVLFLICSVLFSCSSFSQEEIHVILLSGQSNMAGHGNYDELDTSVKKRIEKVADRVLISTSNNQKIKPRPLSYYQSKSSKKYNFTKHFGPELFVGLTLAEANPNQHYLFIKKAVGGTSLYGAWNTEWTQEKANLAERGEVRRKLKLYKTHIDNIRRELNSLKQRNIKYKIIGALWMQGESDTNKEITASNYQKNLQKLIDGYRTEFKNKDLTFVIGQVNVMPRKYKIGPEQVRNAMLVIANSDKNVGIVKTATDTSWSDFPKHSDNVHYNAEGQKRLGTAFAKELIKLSNK